MIKIESTTLEKAYQDAASSLECSVTQLKIEVVQYPSSGFLGLFKKSAIIVAVIDADLEVKPKIKKESVKIKVQEKPEIKTPPKPQKQKKQDKPAVKKEVKKEEVKREVQKPHTILNDTIMPQSFVSNQDDEDEDITSYLADYDDEFDNVDGEDLKSTADIAKTVKKDINKLFGSICFEIDEIDVSVYNETTLLIEFKGEDVALLIGKEGYRYKSLSYMIFNWINTKYQLELRLEIAEFLKNQEESVSRYLTGVKESVNRDGRAQTKVLDGVLVQIALRELREMYPGKYVAIRSTRDGLKYIIINDYHTN
ncbi:Jag N-terminal domain-containing protein [Sulfurimonas sp.]|uniref:Jag N-terminal domain-containing protein n=1 Tax=Sulfurimonas sp. TaxID=2022749 RepID=UPI002600E45F|nr:Jag N-terminal domain-containing protein [Sulfurimonas sp.]